MVYEKILLCDHKSDFRDKLAWPGRTTTKGASLKGVSRMVTHSYLRLPVLDWRRGPAPPRGSLTGYHSNVLKDKNLILSENVEPNLLNVFFINFCIKFEKYPLFWKPECFTWNKVTRSSRFSMISFWKMKLKVMKMQFLAKFTDFHLTLSDKWAYVGWIWLVQVKYQSLLSSKHSLFCDSYVLI